MFSDTGGSRPSARSAIAGSNRYHRPTDSCCRCCPDFRRLAESRIPCQTDPCYASRIERIADPDLRQDLTQCRAFIRCEDRVPREAGAQAVHHGRTDRPGMLQRRIIGFERKLAPAYGIKPGEIILPRCAHVTGRTRSGSMSSHGPHDAPLIVVVRPARVGEKVARASAQGLIPAGNT